MLRGLCRLCFRLHRHHQHLSFVEQIFGFAHGFTSSARKTRRLEMMASAIAAECSAPNFDRRLERYRPSAVKRPIAKLV
jgi:hypothetical protein